MAIGNGEHSRMGTARLNSEKETDEEGKKRGAGMERSKTDTIEISPDGLSQPNQNTMLINIIWYYFKRYGKSTMKLY